MSCNDPIRCFYGNSLNPETGKRSLVFRQSLAYKGSDPSVPPSLEIPCGKCLGCKADQALMWSIRAYHESTCHEQNSFITLTYDADHMPSDGLIRKSELQNFFKRLRRAYGCDGDTVKIRYLACGEYGGQTRRPHYHAIVFGRDWMEDCITLRDNLYTHPDLARIWGKGIVSIAPVTMASICYVCGYVNKKIDDPDTFNLMSRRPGIGHDWLDKFHDDIARTGVVSIEGRSYSVPKRYLLWNEEEFKQLKLDRTAYARAKAKSEPIDDRVAARRGREINQSLKSKARNLREKM